MVIAQAGHERYALMQEAIADRSDIEQIRETITEELGYAVQKRLKVTLQREIVNVIREEVTSTVQQQASELVRCALESQERRPE